MNTDHDRGLFQMLMLWLAEFCWQELRELQVEKKDLQDSAAQRHDMQMAMPAVLSFTGQVSSQHKGFGTSGTGDPRFFPITVYGISRA